MNFKFLILFYRLIDAVNPPKNLIFYILIGLLTLFFEKFAIEYSDVIKNYQETNLKFLLLQIFLISSSFYLNAKFNFQIPRNKLFVSAISFFLISIFSGFLQYLLFQISEIYAINFDRFLTSAIVFPLVYLLHFNFSFRFRKKIGIPVYLNSTKNILEIYQKIGQNVDYIHIDIIDKTMNDNKSDNSMLNLKLAKTLWPTKKMEFHVMSLNPEKWINLIYEYSDTLFIHVESNYFNKTNISKIVKQKKIGIVFPYNTPIKIVKNITKNFNFIKNILILCIQKPGQSGQKFQNKSFKLINFINELRNRSKINLVIDGGVDSEINNKIICERVVSGSYVLTSKNSTKALLKLKV